ncbi:MAG TPA: dUTP diphosphatase [Savagea sp.]
MELTKLFQMQKALDAYIQENREEQTDVFREKGLALLVELGELANETRCFKFWSTKGPSERNVILEEYVDSIHFILSLGIERGFANVKTWPQSDDTMREKNMTEVFIVAYEAIVTFLNNPTEENYHIIWQWYDALAFHLQFSNDSIIEAYIAKNEENYERQKRGY